MAINIPRRNGFVAHQRYSLCTPFTSLVCVLVFCISIATGINASVHTGYAGTRVKLMKKPVCMRTTIAVRSNLNYVKLVVKITTKNTCWWVFTTEWSPPLSPCLLFHIRRHMRAGWCHRMPNDKIVHGNFFALCKRDADISFQLQWQVAAQKVVRLTERWIGKLSFCSYNCSFYCIGLLILIRVECVFCGMFCMFASTHSRCCSGVRTSAQSNTDTHPHTHTHTLARSYHLQRRARVRWDANKTKS